MRPPQAKTVAKFCCLFLKNGNIRTQRFMLIGYARVSKADDQDTAAQVKALKAAGCKRIFEEHASGGRWDRPRLHQALDQLREKDVLVVWKLDRLSRSLSDLLHLMERVRDAGAGFRSLTEAVDTTTPAGRMLMQMLGSFSEFERAMVRERTRSGLAAARERGKVVGRRPKLSVAQQAEVLRTVRKGEKTAADAARLFGVHRATISRLLASATFKARRT
jgi:DNA invertase Pin-like site-specific DNA recombinase